MDLTSTQSGAYSIVTVNAGRIDAAVAIQFKDAMRAQTSEGADHVILDLGQVTFIDSSGLGAIVAAMKQMGAGRKLDLAVLTPDVEKVFRLTRMNSIFTIHESLDALEQRQAG